jgi:hypothetical protein
MKGRMRSVQVSKPKGPLEMVEVIPVPRHVRIKVEACGICHNDSIVKEGLFPGIQTIDIIRTLALTFFFYKRHIQHLAMHTETETLRDFESTKARNK